MQIGSRTREWALVALVVVTAVVANLPDSSLAQLSIQRNYLLGLLALVVFLALFLYLKFQFFFLVVLLALGANMPAQVSDSLGISRWPLIFAMALLIGVSLINYVIAILPTGLEPQFKEKSAEGIKALFYAIEKGNLVYAQKILSMNFDPNLAADNGYTPLMYAAARGNAPMVELLLRNGADPTLAGKDGQTAIELALKADATEAAEMMQRARSERMSPETASAAPGQTS